MLEVTNFAPFDAMLAQITHQRDLFEHLTSPDFLVLLRDALASKAANSVHYSEEYNLALDMFNKAYPNLALYN